MGQVYQNTRSKKHCKACTKGNAMIFSDFHSQVSAGTAKKPESHQPAQYNAHPLEELLYALLTVLNLA
jgi:hypothetical protein